MEELFFDDGYLANRLTLNHYQEVQTGLSNAAGGLGLTSGPDRRFASSSGKTLCVCEALPRV